jgi:two-component system chemotaxis sensor kinase CheA
MSDFTQKFIEEALDFVSQIETAILTLETDPNNAALIDEIFRHMHSLKGSGGMFGFDNISAFTHDMESLFDAVRKRKISLNDDIIDLTYQSIDVLKQMLHDNNSEDLLTHSQNIQHNIHNILSNINEESEVVEKIENHIAINTSTTPSSSNRKTFHIFFQPNKNIFDIGSNPLYLLDELHQLGNVKVIAHYDAIPPTEIIDTSKCYIYWDIFLSTEEDNDVIKDVFLFVEDDSTLNIELISPNNLLDSNSFHQLLDKNIFKEGAIDNKLLMELYSSDEPEPTITEEISELEDKKPLEEVAKAESTKERYVSSIRVDSTKIDKLLNLVSELITTQSRLQLHASLSKDSDLVAISEDVEKISRQLRENAFDMSLIPIHNLATRFKRMVRDLSKDLGKEVKFDLEGTDTELDKSIIEQLADPIMHLLRNAIDHGIETPKQRIDKGKDSVGTISLKAFYSGTFVHICIQDDGKGLDPDKIKAKAHEKGLLKDNKVNTNQDIFDLIFLPGFSTTQIVSGVSGRGVGMDVVKQKIEELRGEVNIESELGKGTNITLKIPLTLSIIDGLLVQVGSTQYIIPLSSIHKISKVSAENINQAYNNVVVSDGIQIPFIDLGKEFNDCNENRTLLYLIEVAFENKMVGLTIDKIIGEYQTVLKPLGRYMRQFDVFSGASVLGDGKVALVLDTNKLVNHYSN